jgi:hypothetical protein
VNVRLSSSINRGSIVLGLIKYPPEIAEPVLGNHRTNVRIGLESFDRRGKNRSGSEFLGASYNHIIELVVLGLVDDKLFDADAVLTSVLAERNSAKCVTVGRVAENLQDATHPDTDVSVQVSAR